MDVYRIRDWNDHFENNRTRDLVKMHWVPVPNKQDGDGYTSLVDHEDGAAHFGAWCAIVQVASKCEPRGTLMRETGKPHDARSLSRVTRIPAPILQAALDRLTSDEIGWIEVVATQALSNNSQQGAATPQDSASTHVRAHACANRERTDLTENVLPIDRIRAAGDKDFSDEEKAEVSREAKRIAAVVKAKSQDDRNLLLLSATLLVRQLVPRDAIERSIEAVKKSTPKNPAAYFRKCLKSALDSYGLDFHAIEDVVQLPQSLKRVDARDPPSVDPASLVNKLAEARKI